MYDFEDVYRDACLMDTLSLSLEKINQIIHSDRLSNRQKKILLSGPCVSYLPEPVLKVLRSQPEFRHQLSALVSVDKKFMANRFGSGLLLFKTIISDRLYQNIVGMQWCTDLFDDGWRTAELEDVRDKYWELFDEGCVSELALFPQKLISFFQLIFKFPVNNSPDSPAYWRELFFRTIRGEMLFMALLENWPTRPLVNSDWLVESFSILSAHMKAVLRLCDEQSKAIDSTSTVHPIVLATRQIIRAPLLATNPANMRKLLYIHDRSNVGEYGQIGKLLWFYLDDYNKLITISRPPQYERIHQLLFHPQLEIEKNELARWSMDLFTRLPTDILPDEIAAIDPEHVAPVPFLRVLTKAKESMRLTTFAIGVLKSRPDISNEILYRYPKLRKYVPKLQLWH